MTLEEWGEQHCPNCGTQRCYGVYDAVCRGGCGKLQTDFPPNVQGITDVYDSVKCIATEIGFGHRFNDDLTIWFDGYDPLEDRFHSTRIVEL